MFSLIGHFLSHLNHLAKVEVNLYSIEIDSLKNLDNQVQHFDVSIQNCGF